MPKWQSISITVGQKLANYMFFLETPNLARESHNDRQVVNLTGVTAMRLLKSMMILMVFTGLLGFGLSAVILA